MGLLEDAMETCVLLNRQTASDGYGGYITRWVDGAEFRAAIVFDTSMQARTAEKQGVTSLYTVTTSKNIALEYNDVFRREKDGRLLRVTSDGKDRKTPEGASLDMREVTAESFVISGQGQSDG